VLAGLPPDEPDFEQMCAMFRPEMPAEMNTLLEDCIHEVFAAVLAKHDTLVLMGVLRRLLAAMLYAYDFLKNEYPIFSRDSASPFFDEKYQPLRQYVFAPTVSDPDFPSNVSNGRSGLCAVAVFALTDSSAWCEGHFARYSKLLEIQPTHASSTDRTDG